MTAPLDPTPPGEDLPERAELRVQDIVMRYFEDSALWPVLIVILAHIIAAVGFVLLLAVRNRNFGAMGAMLALFYASFAIVRWEWKHLHALRTLTITTAVVWILSAVVAHYGHTLHFL